MVQGMVELTRLNGNALVINSDLIKFAESSPDTMLTLINGEKIMVRESCAEVVERIVAYRARLLAESLGLNSTIEDGVRGLSIASAATALRAANAETPRTEMELDDEALQRRRRPEER
jgi:flagellar protein FlbD